MTSIECWPLVNRSRRLISGAGRGLARHRRGRIAPWVDAALLQLHRGYENLNYDFAANGERWVLERLAQVGGISVVFDVGANVGDWTRLACEFFPDATIHSFEIVPETHTRLAANLAGRSHVHVHDVGLSDHHGDASINYIPEGHGVATLVDGATEAVFGVPTERRHVRLAVGDAVCLEHGITNVDFLKLDVEGAEYDALKGFGKMLTSGAIKVVQFEYGYVNIFTKHLLLDFYELLEAAEMVVGKLYPNYVDFRAYQVQHEDFLGPNFLAVHSSEDRLIAALSR